MLVSMEFPQLVDSRVSSQHLSGGDSACCELQGTLALQGDVE